MSSLESQNSDEDFVFVDNSDRVMVPEPAAEPVAAVNPASEPGPAYKLIFRTRVKLSIGNKREGEGTLLIGRDETNDHFLTVQIDNNRGFHINSIRTITRMTSEPNAVILNFRNSPAEWRLATELPHIAEELKGIIEGIIRPEGGS